MFFLLIKVLIFKTFIWVETWQQQSAILAVKKLGKTMSYVFAPNKWPNIKKKKCIDELSQVQVLADKLINHVPWYEICHIKTGHTGDTEYLDQCG